MNAPQYKSTAGLGQRLEAPLHQDEGHLLDYLEGRLAADDAIEITQHLEHCAACRALASGWQPLDQALARSIQPATLSAGFAQRLRQRLDQEPLPETRAAREERKILLEAELAARWADCSKRFLRAQVPQFLDNLGYAVAAGMGGYFLFRWLLRFLAVSIAPAASLPVQWVIPAGLAIGCLILLAGLLLAGKRPLTPLMGKL